MTQKDILDYWAKYSEYDENQTRFNLMSTNYRYHETGKKMAAIMQFDPTGIMAVLYAKLIFTETCKLCNIKVFDILENPDYLADEKQMWDVFMSDDVKAIETQMVDNIDGLIQKTVPTKEIGNRNKEKEKESLYNSIETVVEELTTCHEEVYLTGPKPIGKITNYSTHIHVFRRMSECVLAIERPDVSDGMYLCFIRNEDSADCCFAFMIKSNGNILAVTERVAETFPGQHAHSRNARWSEAKKYKLFPYDYIFSYDDHDYLGYSTSQVIDDSKLAFFNLGPDAYLPLLLAMACISNKYTGEDLSGKKTLMIDTMLTWNLISPSPAQTALIVPTDSAIATRNAEYTIPFDSDGIRDWTYGKEHHWGNVSQEIRLEGFPTGIFSDEQNLFDKLYGDGFVLDPSRVLVTDPHLRNDKEDVVEDALASHTKLVPHAEFITTKEYLDLIAYQQGRKQLAEHIRNKMVEELIAFGGADAIDEWFANALQKNRDKILDFCVDKYKYLKNGGTVNVTEFGWTSNDPDFLASVSMREDKYMRGVIHPFNDFYIDKDGHKQIDKCTDKETGTLCSIEFVFCPRNEKELETLFGPVPKVLKGWSTAHRYAGNNLIDITDPVGEIGNICESREQSDHHYDDIFIKHYWEETKKEQKIKAPRTSFDFSVAFSKNGFKKLLKERTA